MTNCNVGKDIKINETPKTAIVIKNVSHSPAVIMTGKSFCKFLLISSLIKYKTFCALTVELDLALIKHHVRLVAT